MFFMQSCTPKTEQTMENPLLSEWNDRFGVPPFDRIKAEHFAPALEQAMSVHNAEIDAIVTNNDEPTFENTVLAYDNSGKLLERVELCFSLLCAAETNTEMQAIEQEMSPKLTAHSGAIMMNDALFERVKSVYERRGALGLDSLQLRLTEKLYRRFVRGGALLSVEDKEQLRKVDEELSAARVKYAANLLAANSGFELVISNQDDLDGLPSSIRDAAASEASARDMKGKWVFTTKKPSMLPFLTYSSKRELREKLYRGYLDRCNYNDSIDNKQVINDIVRLRTERAHLLGYPTHAHYVLDVQMARTPENVYAMMDELWAPALERAKAEMEAMREMMKEETGLDDFASWDWWYYAEKVRKRDYSFDESSLRPYFSLENVRSGIFELSNRLYGLTFRPVQLPVYHEDCETYEVLDEKNEHLGVLYLDYFPRDGKSGGAWCGEYRTQSFDAEGNRIAPIVSIVCNFPRPTGGDPALLSIDETQTFFHEFGHALHNLFSQVKYGGLGGVERDFVELPSQIMENWALEPEMLRRYALHHRTNDPIPHHLIEKLQRSRHFNQGFNTVELLAASLTDMDIHTIEQFSPIDVNEFERKMLNERRGLMEQIAPRYRYPYFSHIFDGGYSSGYYSYLWAEVLDKDAYQAFVESGDIFNKRIATDFRNKVLARGGEADGMDLYRDFRGADPDRKPLLLGRGLIEEEEVVEGQTDKPTLSINDIEEM
ncbi:MAG: M3 family metallopeptidase [Rikenellaceae bacterium]|nr:M3 family metallopeptidase [Rikenellaceae bacterium]